MNINTGFIILLIFTVGLTVGAFFAGRYSVFPTVKDRNASILELNATIERMSEEADNGQRQEYHRAIYDMCIWMGALANKAVDCNAWVNRVNDEKWYDIPTRYFVWPPKNAESD